MGSLLGPVPYDEKGASKTLRISGLHESLRTWVDAAWKKDLEKFIVTTERLRLWVNLTLVGDTDADKTRPMS